MLFLRRHWPDLVIVSFIVLLLAGFATLLLGGDPRREVNAETLPGGAAPSPAPVAQADPQKSAPVPAPAPTLAETAEATAIPQAPDRAESAPTPAPETAEPAAPIEPAEDLQTIPAQGADAATAPQAAAPDAATPTPDPTPTEPARTEETATDEPTVTPAPGGPVVTSRAGTPTRAEYRLSAGVFGSEALARERTEAIAKLGYTVHFITVDAGVVAQVGPFADGEAASKAAADVRRVYGNIAVYAPVVKPSGETPAAPAESSDAAPASPTPAPAPQAAPAPAPASPLYLQVGAFDRQESAAKLLDQLRSEGLNPTVSAPPGRKVRVLVGPFGGDTLLATEQKLDGLGVDHFRVR